MKENKELKQKMKKMYDSPEEESKSKSNKKFSIPQTETIEKMTEIKQQQNDSFSCEKDVLLNLLEGSVKSDEKPPTVIPDESSEDEEKKVRFKDEIINESSLNPSLIERIRHNQKYNDD